MIKMQIIGHLGKDAEINIHGTDSVINFNVAHTDKYKDGNGALVSKTTWVSCSWWVERSTIAQYMKKGTQVYVEGIPEAKLWGRGDDKKASLNCRVYKVELLGSSKRTDEEKPKEQTQSSTPDQSGYIPYGSNNDDFSDLPF